MNRDIILWPLAAMALLVFLVWCRMYLTRVREIRQRRIHPQALATRASARTELTDSIRVADNFANLFELPVLFYVAVLVLFVSDRVDGLYLALAWAFVALRVVHSLIHTTYNRVMHRFLVYVASAVPLWAIWMRIAVQWLGG